MLGPLWNVLTFVVAPYQDRTIKQFLIEKVETKRNQLVKLWLESKISELNIVNITSVLLVAVFCATFSWYDTAASPWSTMVCWMSGLIMSIGSLVTAAQQTLSLGQLKTSPDPENQIRDILGQGTINAAGTEAWQPTYSGVYILQMPVMMLKLSIILFVAGLGFAVWDASIKKGRHSAETKIAIAYTVSVIFVGGNYVISSIFLYRKTSKAKVE